MKFGGTTWVEVKKTYVLVLQAVFDVWSSAPASPLRLRSRHYFRSLCWRHFLRCWSRKWRCRRCRSRRRWTLTFDCRCAVYCRRRLVRVPDEQLFLTVVGRQRGWRSGPVCRVDTLAVAASQRLTPSSLWCRQVELLLAACVWHLRGYCRPSPVPPPCRSCVWRRRRATARCAAGDQHVSCVDCRVWKTSPTRRRTTTVLPLPVQRWRHGADLAGQSRWCLRTSSQSTATPTHPWSVLRDQHKLQ